MTIEESVDIEGLARGGLDWLVASGRESGDGVAWPVSAADDEVVWSLYQGTAGVVVGLMEGQRHFGDDAYGDTAILGARAIAGVMSEWPDSSLYGGAAGFAVVLRAVGELLDDAASAAAASQAWELVRSRFDGQRWGSAFELASGNAGFGLAALSYGDMELAVQAVEPYLTAAEQTPSGVHWQFRSTEPARLHHFLHGTAGIAAALVAVGQAAGREDLTSLGQAAAADLVSRNEAGSIGFVVPHSDPQLRPERTPRYSYGWCNGTTGDARAFQIIGQATKDPQWDDLVEACWYTVTNCGLPERLRPGFWDNNGCCCGTAGVLAFACDRIVKNGDGRAFADTLARDLTQRATTDTSGARWSNVEHTRDSGVLQPRAGWAMGNAGIVRELMRYQRITTGGDPSYAITLPDQTNPNPPIAEA